MMKGFEEAAKYLKMVPPCQYTLYKMAMESKIPTVKIENVENKSNLRKTMECREKIVTQRNIYANSSDMNELQGIKKKLWNI